jgi:uncharacterized protein
MTEQEHAGTLNLGPLQPEGENLMTDHEQTDRERHPELQVLTTEECYRLLATQQIGRLGVNAEHYPLIFPVNYALDHGVIVIRMGAGTKLAATHHANVTFEVDDIDQRTRSGWSVLVRGRAEKITPTPHDGFVARTQAAGVAPWAPGEHGYRVRLTPHGISGRRIVPGQLPPPFEAAAYL